MRIQELHLSRAAAVDETEEEEPVEFEDEMEMEPLPLPVAGHERVHKCPTAVDDFRCEGPWVSAGQFRFRFIYPKVPVEEYHESEGEMEPVPVDDQERVQEPLPVPVDDHERVQDRSSRRRQQQADASDGPRCKRPRRVQERRNDAGCKRPMELLPILFTKKEQYVKAAVLRMKFEIGAGTLTHDSLLKKLQELKIRYEREFHTCDVAGTVSQFVQPLVRSWFLGWQEAMEESKPRGYHDLISRLADWRDTKKKREPTIYFETIASWKELLLPDQKYMCPDAATCPYTELVTAVVLPVMRRYIINSCDTFDTPDFIETWVPLLPQVVLEALLMQALAPKLSAILDSWPSERSEYLCLWKLVKPWSHLVREKLKRFVRRRIICTGMSDKFVLWMFKEMIDPADWEDLAMRHFIPILKVQLQQIEFTRTIHLFQQQFDQFRSVLSEAGSLIPLNRMVRLLESDFFPNWFGELYDWLDSGEANLDEVLTWYKSWRRIFTLYLFEHERIQLLLTSALHMMLKAANGEPVEEPWFYPNYNPIPAPTVEPWYERPFKELIGEYAVDHDFLFVPKFGKFHDGLPVYTFGSVSICLHPIKRLLYAQIRQGGVATWKSVSLTDLLAMNN